MKYLKNSHILKGYLFDFFVYNSFFKTRIPFPLKKYICSPKSRTQKILPLKRHFLLPLNQFKLSKNFD